MSRDTRHESPVICPPSPEMSHHTFFRPATVQTLSSVKVSVNTAAPAKEWSDEEFSRQLREYSKHTSTTPTLFPPESDKLRREREQSIQRFAMADQSIAELEALLTPSK